MRQGRARWRSGSPGFDTHRRHRVVSLSKTHQLPTVLANPRKSWLRPDMTEQLLTGALSISANKTDTGKCKSTGVQQKNEIKHIPLFITIQLCLCVFNLSLHLVQSTSKALKVII